MQATEGQVGPAVIGLANTLRRLAAEGLSNEPRLTSMQVMFLGYLDQHREGDVFQKDLERAFQIRRSTATGILQVMEREGYLARIPVPQDARLKKLVLTARGQSVCNNAKRRIDALESRVRRSLSDAELTELFGLLARIQHNLDS